MVGRALHLVNEWFGTRAIVWGGLLAALAATLCFVPLFDVLGYDFSFALGLAASFAAVDIGHGVTSRARTRFVSASAKSTEHPSPPLAPALATALATALGVLVLPLVLSLANALRVRNCNFAVGLAFFALLPASTAAFGSIAGVLVGRAISRFGRWCAWLMPTGSIAWTLLRLYFDPAVFALDPFAGYFPGPIYDEALTPPGRLVHYRLANLVWIAAAVAIAAAIRSFANRQPRKARFVSGALATGLSALGLVLFVNRGTLGFHLTHATLHSHLSRLTSTPHHVVHSHPTGVSATDLELLHRDLEFRHQQLEAILGVTPTRPITVYLFNDGAQKKNLVGAGGTLYAKPWSREIFIQVDRFPAQRLRHELAHVFAGSFGDPVFGVAFALRPWPMLASGLIEGLAEAADFGDPGGTLTTHQEAQAMIANGQALPLHRILGVGFTTASGARAYTLAGSFCRYLLDTYGAAKLRAIYHTAGDFPGVYGLPLDDLERGWKSFLEKKPVDDAGRARVREHFRRGAIFKKVCARELAARVARAKSLSSSSPRAAVDLLRSVCHDDPSEPTFTLDLADALAGAGDNPVAMQTATNVQQDETMTLPLRARAANLVAAIAFHAGDDGGTRQALEAVLTFATDEGEQRTAVAKLRALVDPAARATLGRVLFGASVTQGIDPTLALYLLEEFARQTPDEALGPYLVGRQLVWRDPRLGLQLLTRACPQNAAATAKVPLPGAFERECWRLVGDAAFRAGDLPLARVAFARIKDRAVGQADAMRADDFIERIAWEEKRLQGESVRR